MATMFARHGVLDFAKWKQVYDDFATYRKANGVTGAAIFRDSEDPNKLTIIHHFNSMDAATAFADSDELRAAMQQAGVTGPPEIWFSEQVENTSH